MSTLPFPAAVLMASTAPLCLWSTSSEQGAHVKVGTQIGLTAFENSFNAGPGAQPGAAVGTVSRNSGKRYFEVFFGPVFASGGSLISGLGGAVAISPAINTSSPYEFGSSGFGCQYGSDGSLMDADTFGSITGYGPTFGASTIIMVAVDLTNNLIWFGKNGTFVGNPAAGTGGKSILHTSYLPACWLSSPAGGTASALGSFKSSEMSYTPPTGFSPWSS